MEDKAMAPNNSPKTEQVARLRSQYPKGTRVELRQMNDPQAPPVGAHGTCLGVDDIGSILVAWDNGSQLNVAYGEDIVRRLPGMSDTVKEQALAIRETGLTNMFDTATVQRLAFERGYYELVDFIETAAKVYVTFIMTGNVE
jgi:hypothetical protein